MGDPRQRCTAAEALEVGRLWPDQAAPEPDFAAFGGLEHLVAGVAVLDADGVAGAAARAWRDRGLGIMAKSEWAT